MGRGYALGRGRKWGVVRGESSSAEGRDSRLEKRSVVSGAAPSRIVFGELEATDRAAGGHEGSGKTGRPAGKSGVIEA